MALLAPVLDLPRPKTRESDPFPDVNLIDRLLADQNKLQTPVANFAREHELRLLPPRTDLYRHLIPLAQPGEGEQYAFQVELDKCTSCKACVTACHSLNGLDEDESWRDIGVLDGGEDDPGWKQTVTSACHHCAEPECLHGCPVAAYEKDAETGIVRHLDDQCIGCEYCVLKCPYDVPKFNEKRGIVRKCDMCHQRLAVGEAPACVQACPNEAIRIVNVDLGTVRRERAKGAGFLIGAPSPALTLPTTQYLGREVPATAQSAGREELRAEPAHDPLVAMLVLTQAGVGLFSAGLFAGHAFVLFLGVITFLAGMMASVSHLGKPLGAWRFFLGLRTSWLSREILAFGLVPPMFALAFAPSGLIPALLFTVAGLAAVFTSVMVYHDTGRPFWGIRRTSIRFFGTTLVFALTALMASGVISFAAPLCVLGGKLLFELSSLLSLRNADWSPARHSARLQLGPLRSTFILRMCLGVGSVCLLPLWPLAALGILLLGEVLERRLFFQSVWAPRMTGLPSLRPTSLHD